MKNIVFLCINQAGLHLWITLKTVKYVDLFHFL